MEKKLLGILGFFLFILFVPFALGSEIQETIPSADKPVIIRSFASTAVKPGETWKVYLKAAHPNGEMNNIFAAVIQRGVGEYPMNVIRIKKENEKNLSGYLFLVTSGPWKVLEFVNINLTIWIQDKSGNYSEPAIFSLSFHSRASQEAPPPDIFKEQELGAIMVNLKSSPRG
jgi:hypothetical protein